MANSGHLRARPCYAAKFAPPLIWVKRAGCAPTLDVRDRNYADL
ncbi:MAG: hypothetical protein ACM3KT_00605 [Deltaproteobacteria bacterium]|nr:hypothetical protein [Rudaea sp.]